MSLLNPPKSRGIKTVLDRTQPCAAPELRPQKVLATLRSGAVKRRQEYSLGWSRNGGTLGNAAPYG